MDIQIKEFVNHFGRAMLANRAALFLGAGISRPFGVPDWASYLSVVADRANPSTRTRSSVQASEASPLVLARYIRESLQDVATFNTLLQSCLYENYIDNPNDPIMRAILNLLSFSVQRRMRLKVITYNFDCVLEKFIDDYGIGLRYVSYDFGGGIDTDDPISIFHCHGKLPFEFNEPESVKLIFDETEYHSVYYDQYNRSNLNQINSFIEDTCVFIGTSLTDPNTRRLLDYAKAQRSRETPHYIFRKRPLPVEGEARREIEEIFDVDAISLGCRNIWVSDFGEIANILGQVRPARR